MRPAHDTEKASARKRARRWGRKLALVAALVTCAVQAAAIGWSLPGLTDFSPDAVWPLRSLLSVERWPVGELPADKYPEGWHLVAGSFEHAAAHLLLDAGERGDIVRLREQIAVAMQVHVDDPGFDPLRMLLETGGDLERPLSRLVAAGRIAALLMAVLLSLAASEIASCCAGPRFGWIAGLSIGLMPATAHYAATLNTDVPALAWCALAWALAMRAARGAARWPFLACGAAMGLAVATKDQAVAVLPGVLLFALARRRRDPAPLSRRFACVAAGAAASYVLTSGLLQWPTWRDHVRFILGAGSQPYREFPFTPAGLVGLLQATGDAFLVAGGLVGAAGVALLLLNAGLRRRWHALMLLAPAIGCVGFFLIPSGYVYPRFTLPLCLCGAVALAWALANSAGAAGGRRRRVWLGGLVALWSLGEASGVIEAKWDDVRPESVARLAELRAPGDETWICAEPSYFAPVPPIAPPCRFLTLREVGLALRRGAPRPRFLWLAVDRHLPLAGRDVLEQLARERLHMRLVARFDPSPRAPLANDRGGLLLPVVALFESEAK